MRLRLARALTAIAVTILVAACDGDEPAPTARPACKVVIGTMGDLSGPTSDRGIPIFRGVELAVDEAEAEGRLECDLELQVEDTRGDPDLARERGRSLARTDRLVACLCGYTSDEATAAGTPLDAAGVLMSGPATDPSVSGLGFGSWFAAAPNRDVEAAGTAAYIRDVLEPEDVAVLDDGTATGIDRADRVAQSLGGLATIRGSVAAGGGALDEVARKVPEVVYLGGEGGEPAAMGVELREREIESVLIASSEVLTAAPEEMPEGGFLVLCPCVEASLVPDGTAFNEAFRAAYDSPPGPYSAEMYDVTRLVVEALRGADAEDGTAALRRRVVGFFDGAEGVEAISGPLSWSPEGELEADPGRDVWVYEWRGSAGAFVPLAAVGDLR